MSNNSRPRRIATRALVGLAGIALAGATVWAAQAAPLPELQTGPPNVVLSPVPGDQHRVCPGPLTLLGQSSADPTAVGYKGYAELSVAGVDEADLEIEGIRPAVEAASGVAAPTATASGLPASIEAPGMMGDRATSLMAAQTVAVVAPGAAGFASTVCATPSADQWLVAGSTVSGFETVLTLTNPTSATAVVRAELFGQEGVLPTAGLDGIEIPAQTQVAVSLSGVAPDEPSLVVHLTTRGSAITASLHETGVDGLTSNGIDIAGAAGAPAARLDFVGVPFPTTSAEEDESVFANRGATLRLFVPGGAAAEATITLRDAEGTELEPLELTLPPGVVSDVPLGAYPVGRYTVTVESSGAVVGALRASLVTEPYDFAWYQASPPLEGTTALAVPPGPQPRLHLATTADVAGYATLVSPDGATERIPLEPGLTAVIDVEAGAYRLEGLLDVVASITYDGPGQMSGIPVVGGSPLAADVTVFH